MTSGNPAFASSLVAHPGIRQLVKFCIVGASSTIIDLTIFNVLLSCSVAPVYAVVGGFIGGVSNGFFWNRRWTFKERQGSMAKQGPIFFATNLVGLTLNILVTTLALIIAAHLHLTQSYFTPEETMRMILFRTTDGHEFSRLALNAAKLCATVVVTAWNFSASKFITFRS